MTFKSVLDIALAVSSVADLDPDLRKRWWQTISIKYLLANSEETQ